MPHVGKSIVSLIDSLSSSPYLISVRGVSSRVSQAPFSLENEADQKKILPQELALKDIPGPSPSIPFIGTGWQYFPGGRYNLSSLHDSCVDKYKRYGPVVREEFQWRHPVVHLFNPQDFEVVFRNQGVQPLRPISEFVKHYRLKNPDKYDTPGLANSVGEEWQRLRHVLAPVLLQLNALGGLVCEINDIGDDFVNLLRAFRDPKTHLITDLQEVAYRLSLESIYFVSLDSRLGCLSTNLQQNTAAFDMIKSVKLLFEAFHELFFGLPLWKYYQTKSYQKLDKAESIMYTATNNRIQDAIEKARLNGPITDDDLEDSKKPTVLQTLLNTKGLTDKEIRITVIDLISGGIFTVTNALSFLLYHLSRNPAIQEKVYRELQTVAPDGVITSERLKKLNYLKACVKESFRLTPTIPCIARILPVDIKVSGYHIPAGTPIFCNFMVACKQPEKFPDPESYLPDRWMDKNTRNLNPYAMLPFGFGSRMCVGRRFAEMEMYIALAKIVHNFRLVSTGQEVKCKQAFIVVPSEPVSVQLIDRS